MRSGSLLSHFRSLIFGYIMEIVTGPFPRPLCVMLGVAEDGKYGHIFYSSRESDPAAPLYAVIIGTIFGGLYLIPLWSSSFPSSPEKHLWNLSTIFIIIDPFLLLCWVLSGSRYGMWLWKSYFSSWSWGPWRYMWLLVLSLLSLLLPPPVIFLPKHFRMLYGLHFFPTFSFNIV